jgi:hypothetical protein
VVVRRQVSQPRRRLAQRRAHLVDVPAALRGHRHRHDPSTARPDRVQRTGVGRQFGDHPLARSDEQAQQQIEAVQRAVGDQDLIGSGGGAARGEAGRDRVPQHG